MLHDSLTDLQSINENINIDNLPVYRTMRRETYAKCVGRKPRFHEKANEFSINSFIIAYIP